MSQKLMKTALSVFCNFLADPVAYHVGYSVHQTLPMIDES
jgi:hypothetical protein